MEEGWLDGEQPDEFVEVIDGVGKSLGWILRREAKLLRLIPQVIETPPRYLDDHYVWYHAQLINERELFKDGRDLNDVQLVLLSSIIINRRKAEFKERDRAFEENMFINNSELYKVYMDKKIEKDELSGGVEVEQRIPSSVEEFLATLASFSEGEASDSDKGRKKAEGWLDSFLSDEDLSEMEE